MSPLCSYSRNFVPNVAHSTAVLGYKPIGGDGGSYYTWHVEAVSYSSRPIGKQTQEKRFYVKASDNRPFPNDLWPLFQSESWCSSFHVNISFHSHANEN